MVRFSVLHDITYSIAWYFIKLYSIAWYCMVLHDMVLHDFVWYDIVLILYDLVWYCMALSGIDTIKAILSDWCKNLKKLPCIYNILYISTLSSKELLAEL